MPVATGVASPASTRTFQHNWLGGNGAVFTDDTPRHFMPYRRINVRKAQNCVDVRPADPAGIHPNDALRHTNFVEMGLAKHDVVRPPEERRVKR